MPHRQLSDWPTPFYKDSYALQPRNSTQAQRVPVQSQYVASYRRGVPIGSEMTDEWGYTSTTSSAPQVSSVLSMLYMNGDRVLTNWGIDRHTKIRCSPDG